jgi:hypothetical protein
MMWRRLFPIRFRQLSSEKAFNRWDVVEFKYTQPTSDRRPESCKVYEDSIRIVGHVSNPGERSQIVDRGTVASELDAMEKGWSLAIVRPKNVSFRSKLRTAAEIAEIKRRFADTARQSSVFDKELAGLQPCPYSFFLSFEDAAGRHTKRCSDWETEAAFLNFSRRYGAKAAIDILHQKYTEDYVKAGLAFALGNIAARPRTWQLLGIFPSPEVRQGSLF